MAVSFSTIYRTVSFLFLDRPDVVVDRWHIRHKLHNRCQAYIVAWIPVDIIVKSDILDRVVVNSDSIVHSVRGERIK